jgi:hypothetical protein
MNKFDVRTLAIFRSPENAAFLRKVILDKNDNSIQVRQFLDTNLDSLMESFITNVETEFMYSKPIFLRTTKVTDQVKCLNRRFLKDRLDLIKDVLLNFKSVATYDVTDGFCAKAFTAVNQNPRQVVCDADSDRYMMIDDNNCNTGPLRRNATNTFTGRSTGTATAGADYPKMVPPKDINNTLNSWKYAARGRQLREDNAGDATLFLHQNETPIDRSNLQLQIDSDCYRLRTKHAQPTNLTSPFLCDTTTGLPKPCSTSGVTRNRQGKLNNCLVNKTLDSEDIGGGISGKGLGMREHFSEADTDTADMIALESFSSAATDTADMIALESFDSDSWSPDMCLNGRPYVEKYTKSRYGSDVCEGASSSRRQAGKTASTNKKQDKSLVGIVGDVVSSVASTITGKTAKKRPSMKKQIKKQPQRPTIVKQSKANPQSSQRSTTRSPFDFCPPKQLARPFDANATCASNTIGNDFYFQGVDGSLDGDVIQDTFHLEAPQENTDYAQNFFINNARIQLLNRDTCDNKYYDTRMSLPNNNVKLWANSWQFVDESDIKARDRYMNKRINKSWAAHQRAPSGFECTDTNTNCRIPEGDSAASQIPPWRVAVQHRFYDRKNGDESFGQGDRSEREGLIRGYDMSTLYCRVAANAEQYLQPLPGTVDCRSPWVGDKLRLPAGDTPDSRPEPKMLPPMRRPRPPRL